MKISTKLKLAVYVPIIIALFILAALGFSYQDMRSIQDNGDNIRQIRSSITELNHVVYSYTLYHEERPKQQFLSEFDNLTGLIARAEVGSPEQRRLLDSIRADSLAMQDLFSQLVFNHENSSTLGGDVQGAEDRLVGSLLLRSYQAFSDAALLRGLMEDGMKTSEIRTIALIFFVIILATIPLTVILARTRRGIMASLSNLSKGAAVIGEGNLDHRIEEKGKDEISDLSRAFNRMTSSLKNVTASKRDLEMEVKERKKTEATLRTSEQRWATTLASIGDGVIATDSTGRITYMNAVAESLTGWKLGQALGRQIAEVFNIINEKTGEVDENPVNKVIREGVIAGLANHTILVRKDGTGIPIDDSGAPIKDTDGVLLGVVLVFRDITERRLAEDLLLHDKVIRDAVVENVGAMLVYLDRDFNFVWVNSIYARNCGFKPEEMVGKNHFSLYPDKENEAIFARVLETGIPVTFHDKPYEFPHHSEGSVTYWDWSLVPIRNQCGRVERLVLSLVETTDRRHMETLIRQERDQLIGILNSMEDGVCILSRELDIEYINPSMQSLYGPVTGQKCYHYFNNSEETCPLCSNPEVFEGKAFKREVHSKRMGVTYEVTDAPLENIDGSISILSIFHDITERKKIELLKDEFIGMVSHEIKTPLTVIIGSLHTAMRKGVSQEQVQELIRDAGSYSDALASIVENLLELSRSQANRLLLKTELIDIGQIAQDVVKRLQIRSSIHPLSFDFPEDLPPAVGDPFRVERVIFNLVENAIKYSPKGGDVTVSARRECDELIVCVSDQGPGISARDQKKLFQSFEQLGINNRSAMQGVGLGLKVCRTLVEAHGGRIWVESKRGKGSSFYFTLPLQDAAKRN